MDKAVFDRAMSCIQNVEIAYAAMRPDKDFKEGRVQVNGQSVGVFESAEAYASSLNGKLVTQDRTVWAFARIDHERRKLVIAIRGTSGIKEWKQNFGGLRPRTSFPPISVPAASWSVPDGPRVLVRQQWLEYYSPLQKAFKEIVSSLEAKLSNDPSYQIEITGHSLGAAIATLLAAELVSRNGNSRRPIALITFASPRVGSDELINHLHAGGVEVFRVFTSRDIVPHVPSLARYAENNREGTIYLDHIGEAIPLFTGLVQQSEDGFLFHPADSDLFFFPLHWLSTYRRALQATFHQQGTVTVAPNWQFSSVLLTVRTGDSLWAGTDSDVYAEVLGVVKRLDYSMYDDLERGKADMYYFPLEEAATIEDFKRFPLKFWMSGRDSWQLRSVTVRVGNGTFEPRNVFGKMEYQFSGDWEILTQVSFGDQEVAENKEARRSAWPLNLQEQLLLPTGELRIETLAGFPQMGRDRFFLATDFSTENGTKITAHAEVGEQTYGYQKWRIELSSASVPSYFLRNVEGTDLVMDAANSTLGDESRLCVWKRHSSPALNQLWVFRPIGPATFLISSAIDPEFGLEVQGDYTVKIRRLTGAPSQTFRLVGLKEGNPE